MKHIVILSIAASLLSFSASAQDVNITLEKEEKIVPLVKMTKPELRVIYTTLPAPEAEEDVVIALGRKKESDPVICREIVVPDFGKHSNGSRIRETREYCNRKSKWDLKRRKTMKIVKEATGL